MGIGCMSSGRENGGANWRRSTYLGTGQCEEGKTRARVITAKQHSSIGNGHARARLGDAPDKPTRRRKLITEKTWT